MCGIYGSTVYYSNELVKAKLEKVNFRGPDFSAFTRIDHLILGHNRLAIIDLDHRSDQPFTYLHLKIVFNGEIYNYQHIKANLRTKGYHFNTNSDTEVIAAAYLEYGADCVNHFNGMFAFVIYDSVEKKLFGARDRLGKKPFYYAHNGVDFEFASQPSQITLGREVNLDEEAISEYFIWGYVPEPRSAWLEIKKLRAGYRFNFNLYTGLMQTDQYWDLDYTNQNIYQGSYNDAKVELKQLLSDAVKIRMQADVPLGVFLSGGIDSSLIAGIAVEAVTKVKTFSIKFNEKGFDESVFASRIASYLGTQHHTIECNYSEGINLIENFANYFDEPFADSSAIPTMLLSKYTKKQVTVALSGDGGDEGFLGYSRYKWLNWTNFLFNYPLGMRKVIAQIIQLSSAYRHKLIGMGISMDKIESLYVYMLGGLEYSWLKQPDLGMHVPFMDIWKLSSRNFLEKMAAFDIKTYLNGDINTKVDRASMAFSLETRAPFMDYRVIEFSQRLPSAYKFNNGVQKRILKDILYDHVPAHMYNRPKSGFTMPLKDWFKHELKDYVMDHLSERDLKNIPGIDVRKSSLMIDEHMTGKWNRSSQIWKLLVLSQWLKNQKMSNAAISEIV